MDVEKCHKRVYEKVSALVRMEADSDIAVAIVAAALVDDELELFIRRHLITSTRAYRDRVDYLFMPSSAFGSFSTKVDLALVMGWISKPAYNDLTKIKDIRNAFAHKIEVGSFEHESIKDKCGNLSFAETFISAENNQRIMTIRWKNGNYWKSFLQEDHNPLQNSAQTLHLHLHDFR